MMASEASLRIELGTERASRIVALENFFQRLKGIERVMANHARAEDQMQQAHSLILAAESLKQAMSSRRPVKQQVDSVMENEGDGKQN